MAFPRRARSSPRLFLGVLLTLTIGLSANAVLTGLIEDLYLRPPAGLDDVDRLRVLAVDVVENDRPAFGFSSDGVDALAEIPGYERVAAFSGLDIEATVGRGLESKKVSAELVSGTYFETLGASVSRGRLIEPSDDHPASDPVVVVSEEYFRSTLGGKTPFVGQRMLDIDGKSYRLIGVTTAGLSGATRREIDLWLPLEVAAPTSFPLSLSPYTVRWLSLVARLEDGRTAQVADSSATTLFRASGAEREREGRTFRIESRSLLENERLEREDRVAAIGWLTLVSLALVLIAVLNASGFLLARAMSRGREMAVRSALGGTKGRLFLLLLVDALILAGSASALASLLSSRLGPLAREVLLPGLVAPAGISPRVVASSVTLALLGAFFSTAVGALVVLRGEPARSLAVAVGSRSLAGSRLRAALVILQVVLTVVLLVSAHQFVLSLRAARAVDLGVETEDLWVVRWQTEQGSSDQVSDTALPNTLRSHLGQIQGVESASIAGTDPFRWSLTQTFDIPGRDLGEDGMAHVRAVGLDYDLTMGLELLEGRWLTASDHHPGANSVVVGRRMAERFWPDGDALGSCFFVDTPEECLEIVGMVADVVEGGPPGEPVEAYYVPLEQGRTESVLAPPILLRAQAGAIDREQIRSEVSRTVSSLRSVEVSTYQQLLEPSYRNWQLGAWLFSVYGLVALLLAVCGLLALLSLEVSERRFELGVRQALGATPFEVTTWVLRSGLGMVSIGLVLAAPAAWAARRLFETQLFGVEAALPGSFLTICLGLLVAGTVACLGPILDARRSDPSLLLRQDS